MKAAGGYFELELNGHDGHYHDAAIKLNNGRNALFCILQNGNYPGIYLPEYYCDVLLQPILKLNIPVTYYKLNDLLDPLIDIAHIDKNAIFLYTNYFGLKDDTVHKLSSFGRNLVIDNAQAFFSKPVAGVKTFYSARKFFGVPDGAYLYADEVSTDDLPVDISFHRTLHLFKRLELTPEEGYQDFISNERLMDTLPAAKMSVLTETLLKSINYKLIIKKRRDNFLFLSTHLEHINLLSLPLSADAVPMAYPFLTENALLRKKLIENRIFIPQYWPHLSNADLKNSIAQRYAEYLLPLPVDQRMDNDTLERMINLIR